MKFISPILLAAAMAMPAASMLADDFDLTSQRSEVQEFNKVPGHVINRNRDTQPVINPTPHEMAVDYGSALLIPEGIKVVDKHRKFASGELDFLPEATKKSTVTLTIDYGTKAAMKAGVKTVAGGYLLTIDPRRRAIDIVGFDETGAFYGLQTLRQLVENAKGILPKAKIADWPDLPRRGVVEGFYGTPWSHEVRLSLIDFYGRNKLNDYIYGPKDDPYHSSPYWRQPYPADQAEKIAELVDACRRARVNFVWAIHPGKDIRWDKADYDSLVSKLDMMYDLGVRNFALFFDDIEGIGTDSHRQAALVNDLTRDFVTAKGDVGKLMICPTDYSQLWANPKPTGQLAIYGEELTPEAEVFWTGAVVCSDLTPKTLDFVNSRIKRPALFWWNYPVTDYCRNIILQGPVYGLDTTLDAGQVAGIESNPMEHGEASKLALYGVADYAWNVGAYNPIDNWERGLRELTPNAADAYRTFAIHNADTETGYRRDESWETVTFPFNDYTAEQFDALRQEFTRVAEAPAKLRSEAGNELLITELDPWLTEFEKLGRRGLNTLDLIKTFEAGNDSLFWTGYVANLMTPDDREAYQAHKSGTMKLQPFYENAMDGMLAAFYEKVTGQVADIHRGVGSYPNLRTTLSKLMLDGDLSTYWTSANAQKTGDWIGLDLGAVRPVDEVEILQGRNSVDDVDYFDNTILEASADGREWTALSDSLLRTYEIRYSGAPVNARYVRIRKLPSEKKNWASVRSFSVNPPSAKRIGLTVEAPDAEAALMALDSNPASTYTLAGTLNFGRRAGADKLVMLMSVHKAPLRLVQFNAKGQEIKADVITSPYAAIAVSPETASFSLTGNATINELIQK